MMWYLSIIAHNVLMTSSYKGVTIMAEMLPSQCEWIVAIVLPILRELHIWTRDKLANNAKPCNAEILLFGYHLGLKCYHMFYVAVFLANITRITVYSIFGVELVLHLYSCFTIINLHMRVEANDLDVEE